MRLHKLTPAARSRHRRKRVGRGPGSGIGKTCGRGNKGQKSRSGYRRRAGFEGGQMPLVRRVPKRGFTNIFRRPYSVVNVGQLSGAQGVVDPAKLTEMGLVSGGARIKILAEGEVTTAIEVKAHRFSAAARRKIESAGGRCEELDP